MPIGHPLTHGSYLQDLACNGCDEILGLWCHDAPPEHILRKDQIILHLNKMSVISGRTRKPCIPVIKEAFPLKRVGSKSLQNDNFQEKAKDTTSHNNKLAAKTSELPGHLDDTERLQNPTHFAQWVEAVIDSQKTDIERISASVNKIENEMHSFKDFMAMVRKELAVRPTNIEIDEIRASVHSLRDEIDESSYINGTRPAEESLSCEDVDLMTQSITSISKKVNEIDSLKLELQLLKNRVMRSEDRARGLSRPMNSRTSTPLTTTSYHRRDQFQGIATGVGRHVPSSTTTEDSGVKRRRISGVEMTDPVAPNAQSSMALRKPSSLSNVQLPDSSPDRLTAEVYERGSSSVENTTDNAFGLGNSQDMDLGAVSNTVAHSKPLDEGQLWASKPSRYHGVLGSGLEPPGSKPPRRSRVKSEQVDPDYIPSANRPKDRRVKSGVQASRRRNSLDLNSKTGISGRFQDATGKTGDDTEKSIVQSVEKDGETATTQTDSDRQQKMRQEALAARERLVKDTIEREMNMAV